MRCKEYCVENAERERKIRMMKKRKGGRQGEIQYDEALSMNFSFQAEGAIRQGYS